MNVDLVHVYVNDTPGEVDLVDSLEWLPVLGPSATVLAQALLSADRSTWRMNELAAVIGVKRSKLADAIERLVLFGAAAVVGTDVLVLRRWMPPVPERQMRRIAAKFDCEVAA